MIFAALQGFSGYKNPPRPAPSVGAWKIHHRLAQHPDTSDRRRYWLSCDAWDCDVEAQAYKAVERKPDKIMCYAAHSYGAGRAFRDWCKVLHRWGREVDLVNLIDPVPRYDGVRNAWPLFTFRSLWGSALYRVPDNVKKVCIWYTVNRESRFSPRGRDVEARDGLHVIFRAVYGHGDLTTKQWPGGLHRIAPEVYHGNIDDHQQVQDECYAWTMKELGLDA